MAAALASLGGLGQLVGATGGNLRSPADQYVGLMQSTTIADRLVDQFGLMQVYEVDLRFDARRELEMRSRFGVGKKDGLVTVEVDDSDPSRAAALANAYVAELRQLTGTLAISEAQQRRAFFRDHLEKTRTALAQAQSALQGSGFNQAILRSEPKAMADGYARLRAEATAAEVRLQTLLSRMAESAPEVQQARSQFAALQVQIKRLEAQVTGAAEQQPGTSPDYVDRYREFKYQETLFELFSRQYELARVDESREGPLVQVVDAAIPPERRSRPRRSVLAVISYGASLLLVAAVVATVGLLRDHPQSRLARLLCEFKGNLQPETKS
jgi:uncharacterized protein involved in exopolysaccharide biosynthesis